MSRPLTRVVPAYAKLNLSLSVVSRRPDGWHDIDSVLVPVDWHDLVGISVGLADADSLSLKVDGPAASGVPTGEANLTTRAARALGLLAGRPLATRVWLFKEVPHGAGLGGGSADAAAVLRAGVHLLRDLGIAIDARRIAAAALDLGSDVPALLGLVAQRVRGRGERLESLRTPVLHVAVASTAQSSTADTYAAVLPGEIRDDGRQARLAELLAAGRISEPGLTPGATNGRFDVRFDGLLGSALEPAACRANPTLASALQRARRAVANVEWHLTGSGGAVFSVAAASADAERLAAEMRGAGFFARACRTIG